MVLAKAYACSARTVFRVSNVALDIARAESSQTGTNAVALDAVRLRSAPLELGLASEQLWAA